VQCADPGAALIPELSWQQEPLRKNRDKQLTFIFRVGFSFFILLPNCLGFDENPKWYG